ncbi:MAG: hypothetical protein PVS2B2_24920 [Candidatus Acidiferrum sp.]
MAAKVSREALFHRAEDQRQRDLPTQTEAGYCNNITRPSRNAPNRVRAHFGRRALHHGDVSSQAFLTSAP